jgi:hypothetical protein
MPFAATDPDEVCTTEYDLATLCSWERWRAPHNVENVPAETARYGF